MMVLAGKVVLEMCLGFRLKTKSNLELTGPGTRRSRSYHLSPT